MASTYLAINVHIIFATKGRLPLIADEWRTDFHAYIGGAINGLGASPIAIGGVADHVHLLVGLRGTHSISDLVREVKKSSHNWARLKCARFQWQEGYGAFSVSPTDKEKMVAYIARQETHHQQHTSADELRTLLMEFGIEYDERFFE